jgi:hypothetical protein
LLDTIRDLASVMKREQSGEKEAPEQLGQDAHQQQECRTCRDPDQLVREWPTLEQIEAFIATNQERDGR